MRQEKMETQLVSHSRAVTPSLCAGRGYDESFDASLLAEARAGSLTAFDQLVHRYETKLGALLATVQRFLYLSS